ncbi:hypothetical protein C8J57DRAFT_1348288 [Mycena rebaudengoi]|nr:hypothetical protein C8J57DRAFT_1348288 [Mycena rebaudengoi]
MESPFANILHTNAVPSDRECKSILDIVEGTGKEAAGLTQKIAEMQALVDGLTAKRDKLNKLIDAHLALVSPARRLPDDIVGAIFLACLPPNWNPIISSHVAPLLLCQISSSWRTVALSTPCLWSSLHIAVPFETTRVQQLNNVVGAWISRSGALPLSISLVSTVLSGPFELRFTTEALNASAMLLQTLIHVSHRWRHIRLSLPKKEHFAPLATLCSDDVPSLQAVAIDSFQGPERSALAFTGATNLHSVSLRDIASVLEAPLQWGSLRHLSLGGRRHDNQQFLTLEAAFDLLRQCANLETCFLSLHSEWTDLPAPPRPPLHMQQLTQLCVLDDIVQGSFDFFDNLVLPSLRTLEYESTSYHNVERLPFSSLLSSSHQLKQLSLRIPGLTESLLTAALRLAPTLQIFYLSGEPITTGYFGGDDNGFLSQLASISQTGHSIAVTFNRSRQVDIGPSLPDPISSGLHTSLHYEPDYPSHPFSPEEGNEDYGTAWKTRSIFWDPRLEN